MESRVAFVRMALAAGGDLFGTVAPAADEPVADGG
jgi:hypothetical protein